jgi:hypothetical protein
MTASISDLDVMARTSVARSSSTRALVATLLCASAIGLIAVFVAAGNHGPQFDAMLAAQLTGGLWLAAILVLAPELKREHGIALAATLLYAIAFALPAVVNGPSRPIDGYVAFFAGWLVVPVAWLANPLVVAALFAYRTEHHNAAIALAAIAFVLALTTLGMPWNGAQPGPGFWFWTLAPICLAIAAIVREIARGSATDAIEGDGRLAEAQRLI